MFFVSGDDLWTVQHTGNMFLNCTECSAHLLYLYSIIKVEYMYVAVRYRQWFHRHSIHNLGTRILVINHLKIVLKGNSKHKTKDWWGAKSSHRAVAALVKFTGRAVLGTADSPAALLVSCIFSMCICFVLCSVCFDGFCLVFAHQHNSP